MTTKSHKEGWLKDFWSKSQRPFWVLVLTIAAAHGLERFQWFESLDHAFLDVFIRFQKPQILTGIYVVEISDQDYRDLFGSTSPLNPSSVLELIKAVRQGDPSVIGVDLDTRDDIWANMGPGYSEILGDPRIVWAGVPNDLSALNHGRESMEVGCPLGGSRRRVVPASDKYGGPTPADQIGVVIVPQDADGVVRRHAGRLPPASLDCVPPPKGQSNPIQHQLDPFDVAVAGKCAAAEEENSACWSSLCEEGSCKKLREDLRGISGGTRSEEEPYVTFAGGRFALQTIQASEFIECNLASTAAQARHCSAKSLDQSQKERLANSVVIVGGNYAAARDEYLTPVGKMAGVELLAREVYAAGNQRYIWESELLSTGIDFVLGVLVIFGFYCFKENLFLTTVVAGAGLLLPPLAVLVASLWMSVWLGAGPMIAALIIERVLEGHLELKELRRELSAHKTAAKALEEIKQTQVEKSRVVHLREQTVDKSADGSMHVTSREVDEIDTEDAENDR
jgi:CHASE2 domain-containing sensor protein